MMYIWSYMVKGLQVCKIATKSQFEKELKEYTKDEQKEIKRSVRFTQL